jgi:hypothetical protein
MGKHHGLQIFAIREARPHPWVISTTRHISQGGVSLLDVTWKRRRGIFRRGGGVLSGKSNVVGGDPYVLTLHVPGEYRVQSAEIEGEQLEAATQTETATIRFVPSATTTVEWTITFAD